ncbi:uncharacterized protein LOC135397385 isoform X2 [Ornithodoros turicata]|uniref:uncharacterized protein LOC135397385 isoform X2 n=1 Tax=Ornithodoros turicata TaxID=34597 RepID=UPI00313944B3
MTPSGYAAMEVAPCLTTLIPDVSTKDELLLKPFSYGFTRELVLRASREGSKKGADAYYYKDGHKMRSKPDVISYLKKNTDIPLSGDNFTFCKWSISKPPHEVVRQAKPAHMARQSPEKVQDMMSLDGKRRQRSQCRMCDESGPSCAQHVTKKLRLKKDVIPDVTSYDASGGKKLQGTTCSSPSNQDSNLKGRFRVTYSRIKSGEARPYPDLRKDVSGTSPTSVAQSRTGASVELCNLHCPQAKDQLPTLQCEKCLCLFHPVCVKAFANLGKRFICWACQKKGVPPLEALKDSPPKITRAIAPKEPKTYIRVRTLSGATGSSTAPQQQRLIQVRNTDSAVAMLLSVINKMKDGGAMSSPRTVTSANLTDARVVVVKSCAGSVQTGSLSNAMSTALCLQPRVVLKSPEARKSQPAHTGFSPKVETVEEGSCNLGDRNSDKDRLTIDEGELSPVRDSPTIENSLTKGLSPLPSTCTSMRLSGADNSSATTSAREQPQVPHGLPTLGQHVQGEVCSENGDLEPSGKSKGEAEPHETEHQVGTETTSETKLPQIHFPHICQMKSVTSRVTVTHNAEHEWPRGNGNNSEEKRGKVYAVLPGNRRVNLRKEATVIVKQEGETTARLHQATMESLTSAYSVLNRVFRFLSVPSLCRAAQVCTTWNSLAQQTHLWERVNLVGIAIKDWDRCTTTLCRMWTHTLVVEGSMWQSLAAHVQRLNAVHNLRVRDATVSDLLVWANLFQQVTSFRASVSNPLRKSPTELGLEGFGRLTGLQDLVLHSPQGLRLLQPVLYPGFPFCGIRRLSLTTVVGGCPVEWFLSSMTLLQELEFGSCVSWTSKSFQAISELSQLRQLTLVHGASVHGLSIALSKLKGLEKLQLRKWIFTESLGACLEQLPELAELHLLPDKCYVDAESNLNALLSCITLKTLKSLTWTVCGHNDEIESMHSVYSLVDQVRIPFGRKCCDCPTVSPPALCCPLSERVSFVLGSPKISPTELADGLGRTLTCTDVVVQVNLAS